MGETYILKDQFTYDTMSRLSAEEQFALWEQEQPHPEFTDSATTQIIFGFEDREASSIVAKDAFPEYDKGTRQFRFEIADDYGNIDKVVIDCGGRSIFSNKDKYVTSTHIFASAFEMPDVTLTFNIGEYPETTALWDQYCESPLLHGASALRAYP